MYFTSQNTDLQVRTSENIATAKAIIEKLGLTSLRFVGYSESNGVSVYFKNNKFEKIRVSDHSVTSSLRMREELLLRFDYMAFRRGQSEPIAKSMTERNQSTLEFKNI